MSMRPSAMWPSARQAQYERAFIRGLSKNPVEAGKDQGTGQFIPSGTQSWVIDRTGQKMELDILSASVFFVPLILPVYWLHVLVS